MIEASQWRLPVRRAESATLPGVIDGSADGAAWSKATTVQRFNDKLFGGIGTIEYSPGANFVGFCSRNQSLLMRLPLRAHDPLTVSNCVWNEQIARPVFSLRFRRDEKLVVQTVEQRISVKSTETAFERNFDGHTRDVRDAFFLTGQILVSVSDDATVRLWGLTQSGEVAVAQGAHSDYVRTACALSERQFVTGSYDKYVHLWDVRSNMKNPALTFKSQYPIEKVVAGQLTAPLGSSSLLTTQTFVAAADVVMSIDWRKASSSSMQAASGATTKSAAVIFSGSFHTKTVSALAVHRSSKSAPATIITGSLDQRIKVLREAPDGSLQQVAVRKAQNGGVTALAIHPDGSQFSVGTSEGFISAFDLASKSSSDANAAGGGGADRGTTQAGDSIAAPVTADRGVANVAKDKSAVKDASNSVRKEAAIATWLRRIHALLVRFRYGLALKTALYSHFPDVVLSTLDELQRRCALHVAVSGHNDRTIVQLLRFATERVSDPKMTGTCLTVLDRIFEIYAPAASESEYFHRELLRCHHVLEELSADIDHIRSATAVMELLCAN